MRRLSMKLVLGAALLIALGIATAPAQACIVACIQVEGPQPVCYRCLDLGFFTNETCYNSGNCACIEYPNSCSPLTATPTAGGRGRARILGPVTQSLLAQKARPAEPSFLSPAPASAPK
jgi:hypothetical protein